MRFRLDRGMGIRVASCVRAQGGEKPKVSTGLKWELDFGAKGEIGLQSELGSHL